MLPDPRALAAIIRPALTRAQALIMPTLFRAVAPPLRRKYKVTAEADARAVETVRRIFAELSAKLEGRRYLWGDRFGAADLTFASLAAPALLPPGHPATASSLAGLPDVLRGYALELRATRAGDHAMRMYRDHRNARSGPS
jgi:glutathione S-transferase